MSDPIVDQHLSQIATHWTTVFQAHQDSADAVRAAQEKLLRRYCGAIYRYLLGALRDPDAADELSQEFALRFVKGYFRRANPERGRFRDYVKMALSNLITDYRKRQGGQPDSLPDGSLGPATSESIHYATDVEFEARWREELLNRTWQALATIETKTGSLFHTVLRYRASHPDATSEQIATDLSQRVGKPLSPANVRQTLHRAREKFADLLLEEVARSLETDDEERLEQELVELNLLPYCKTALQRRQG
jgi:RNA polymerase sigma-70 factor (ECF subfamily)